MNKARLQKLKHESWSSTGNWEPALSARFSTVCPRMSALLTQRYRRSSIDLRTKAPCEK